MAAKKKTPVASGGQETTTGWDVVASGSNDTTVVPGSERGDTTSSPVYTVLPKLTDVHLAELRRSGISDEVIDSSGIYSARNVEALPEPLQWIGSHAGALPALVFPMEEAGVGETWQVKPATPITHSPTALWLNTWHPLIAPAQSCPLILNVVQSRMPPNALWS